MTMYPLKYLLIEYRKTIEIHIKMTSMPGI